MRTPVECRDLETTKCAGDETPGFAVIEQDAFEAEVSFGEWLPTVKTLADISGYRARTSGSPGAVVSRLMGHKNISTTLDTYTHEYNALRHELEIRARVDEAVCSRVK